MFFKKPTSAQWLAVFLGNPGQKYEGSRHNAGFMCAAALEKKLNIKINRLRFRSLTATAEIGGEKVLLLMPQTFMNLSGEAVGEAARFYKIPPERVLVVSDEMSLPVGKLRIRRFGSAGGHNGLKSIIAHLGTEEFPRIRLGVSAPPHKDYDVADWVLSGFSGEDAALMKETAQRAAEAVCCYITEGPDKAMSKFNTK